MDRTNNVLLSELFAEIEGQEFDAMISAESSVRRILYLLGMIPPISELIRRVQQDGTMAAAVLARMNSIAALSVDYRYRNNKDTALAAYLYVILVSSPNLAIIAGRIVLAAQNTSLSNKLVTIILSAWSHMANTQSQEFAFSGHASLAHLDVVDVVQVPRMPSGRVFRSVVENQPSGWANAHEEMDMPTEYKNFCLQGSNPFHFTRKVAK